MATTYWPARRRPTRSVSPGERDGVGCADPADEGEPPPGQGELEGPVGRPVRIEREPARQAAAGGLGRGSEAGTLPEQLDGLATSCILTGFAHSVPSPQTFGKGTPWGLTSRCYGGILLRDLMAAAPYHKTEVAVEAGDPTPTSLRQGRKCCPAV